MKDSRWTLGAADVPTVIQDPVAAASELVLRRWKCLPDETHAFPRHCQDGRGDQGQWHDDQPCNGETSENRAVSRQAGLLIGQAYEAGLDVTSARGERPRRSRNASEVEER